MRLWNWERGMTDELKRGERKKKKCHYSTHIWNSKTKRGKIFILHNSK